MFAAGNGHSEATRVLIQAGTDLNATAGEDNFEVRGRADYSGTALTYAVRHAYHLMLAERAKSGVIKCREYLGPAYEIVAAYEEKKQRVNDAPNVLTFSLICGDVPLLSRLVALGAVKRGSDVLLSVGGYAKNDAPEAVEVLIRAGADVNARSKLPWTDTPLLRAAWSGLVQTIRVLLDAGAEVNVKTGYGGSALNIAVAKGCMECAKELLKRGADPEIPDESGRTPVEALRKAGLLP